MKGISVIICTYNRCESIKDTLNSLLQQEYVRGFDYEVIVVDNNSNDCTKEVVESYIAKFCKRLRYIFEPQQGLSYARNRGIKESKGKIIAFTDDDIILDKKWLLNIYRSFDNQKCDGVGGRILPLYSKDTPKWIKENRDILDGPIPFYDYGNCIKPYDKKTMLSFVGANMAFTKECFNEFGLFRVDLGSGPAGSTGDDTEYFQRLLRAKMTLHYNGNVLAWHKVENNRINLKYITKWCIASGKYDVVKAHGKMENNIICYFGIPRYLIREVTENAMFMMLNLFNKRQFLKFWIKIFKNVGIVQEYRKIYICQK